MRRDRVGLIVEIALELRRRRPGSGPRVAYFDVTLAMHLVQAWSWLLHQLEMVAGGLGAGSDEIPRAVETSEQRLSKRTKRGITSSRSIH